MADGWSRCERLLAQFLIGVPAQRNLSWHVRRFQAAPPKTLATVLEFARKTGMAGLDRDRPLWEFTFIEGLTGGQTALVMKLHHSLTDGVGGMEIARLLFDLEPDPGDLGAMPEAPVAEHLGTIDLARDALGYDWSQLFDFSKRHLASAPGDVASTVRRSTPALAKAPGATPKDSYRSLRTNRTGFIRRRCYRTLISRIPGSSSAQPPLGAFQPRSK